VIPSCYIDDLAAVYTHHSEFVNSRLDSGKSTISSNPVLPIAAFHRFDSTSPFELKVYLIKQEPDRGAWSDR
jgi:hypothetical protein